MVLVDRHRDLGRLAGSQVRDRRPAGDVRARGDDVAGRVEDLDELLVGCVHGEVGGRGAAPLTARGQRGRHPGRVRPRLHADVLLEARAQGDDERGRRHEQGEPDDEHGGRRHPDPHRPHPPTLQPPSAASR
jgi:hypothetical protein